MFEDHRIRNIRNLEFVQTQELCFVRDDLCCDLRQGILLLT